LVHIRSSYISMLSNDTRIFSLKLTESQDLAGSRKYFYAAQKNRPAAKRL